MAYCWLVPPVYLIPRVLVHFLNCRSRGILIVPFWPSSLFWPYLIQGKSAYKSFVVDFLFVQNGRDLFVHGANKETCFGSSSFRTPVLFLKLDSTATSQVHWDYDHVLLLLSTGTMQSRLVHWNPFLYVQYV